MSVPERSNRPNQTSAGLPPGILLIFVIGAWLTTHYYRGVEHDAALYAGQAMARLYPEAFRQDLFFAFGSQDDYTFFTPVFAALARALPLGDAALLLVVLAHIVWVTAAVAFVRRLLAGPGPAAWLGLAVVLGGYSAWGPQSVLAYGEGYVTARVWAEAFALIALVCSLHGKRIPASVFCAISLALHPIIALPAVAFVAFYSFNTRQWLGGVALGTVAAATAVALGALPLDRLIGVMDPEWYDAVMTRATYINVAYWSQRDINQVLGILAVLLTAAIAAEGHLRRAWLAIVATALIGMALALMAAWTHHTFLMQMQTWRVLWLVRIFAMLAAAWLVFDFWPRGRGYRLLLLWLAIGWWAKDYWGGALALVIPVLLALRQKWERLDVPRSIVFSSYLVATVLGLNALVAEFQLIQTFVYQNMTNLPPSRLPAAQFHTIIRELGSVVFPLLLWPVWRLAHGNRPRQLGVFLTVFWFATVAAWHWNQRSPYERDITSTLAREAEPMLDFFPPNALVYWQQNHRIPWFVLRHGNYASGQQTAGLLYSRETALEAMRRIARLAKLGMSDAAISWGGEGNPLRAKEPSFAGLVHLCHDPVLDFVVLTTSFPEGAPQVFPRNEHYAYYAYDCGLLRQAYLDPFVQQSPGHARQHAG